MFDIPNPTGMTKKNLLILLEAVCVENAMLRAQTNPRGITMNKHNFTRATDYPRAFTVTYSENEETGCYDLVLLGVFDIELGACRFAITNGGGDIVEEFTDYNAARARFTQLDPNNSPTSWG